MKVLRCGHSRSETKPERPLTIMTGYANSLIEATIPWIGRDIAVRMTMRAVHPYPHRWPHGPSARPQDE